ncbi:MAG: DUF4870 family protein [Bradymonadia bacterium]|jgi:hypothetical protein
MNETFGLTERPDPSLVTYTHVVYALHAASLLVGVLGAATVVGSFLLGIPSLVAVIMNYARRSDVRGTWLASHFRWQIRTFWFALLWVCVAGMVSAPLVLALGLGILVFTGLATLVGLWVLYRVARGWLALSGARPMPGQSA